MAYCEACAEGAGDQLPPHVTPLEKALAEVELGLLGYRHQPGDSLVRCVMTHGLPPAKHSMILSDLLREDVAREPQFVPSREALRRLSRVSSQHDAYVSSWAAPRATPASDSWRLAALLSDVNLTSDAVAAADADIAAHDGAQRRRAKELHARWTRAHSEGAAAARLQVQGRPAAPRDPRGGGAAPWAAEVAATTRPRLHDGLGQQPAAATSPPSSPPPRAMLSPTEWSALAIAGTPLGHLSRWRRHTAAGAASTVRLDMLPEPPAVAAALWRAEGPRGRRHTPIALADGHLIGHWQRDVEAEAAATAHAAVP